jgi:hypothetical protein
MARKNYHTLAQNTLRNAGLTQAWNIYLGMSAQRWDSLANNPKEERTIYDIVGRLVRWGSISKAQMDFLGGLLDRINNRATWQAQREAERAVAADCPSGRITVEGVVIKTELKDTMYGETLKMALKTDAGYILWGTVPASLDPVQLGDERHALRRGDRIRVTAEVTPSERDPKFGFTKRPTGKFLSAAPPQSMGDRPLETPNVEEALPSDAEVLSSGVGVDTIEF